MGKSSTVGVTKGLRGLIRSMSHKAKSPALDIQEPIVELEEPIEQKEPSPAAAIDEDAKLPDQEPTEKKFKLPDQELTEKELRECAATPFNSSHSYFCSILFRVTHLQLLLLMIFIC